MKNQVMLTDPRNENVSKLIYPTLPQYLTMLDIFFIEIKSALRIFVYFMKRSWWTNN